MDIFFYVILSVQMVICQPRNFVFTFNSYNGELLVINFITGLFVAHRCSTNIMAVCHLPIQGRPIIYTERTSLNVN
jgi:hypothetical protein